jgi:xanthine dehydrogenase accessory factor
MMDIYQEIINIRTKGQDAALVTVISTEGSTPRKSDAKMLVLSNGSTIGTIGGGNLELMATKEALKVIQTEKSKRVSYGLAPGQDTGMICGGNAEVFIEPIVSLPAIIILGGGHIGLALSKIGKLLGFKIIIVDDRPEFAGKERFPEADLCIVEKFENTFSNIKVDLSSYIVIVTHGHKGDEVALAGALNTNARYIGMIGSAKKINAVYTNLKAKGYSEEQIGRVHAPIGLPINAQTPEEIAVCIMAEIISIRRAQSP